MATSTTPSLCRLTSAILLATLLYGCASKQNTNTFSERSRRISPEETSFAAGAGRPPSSATSFAFAKILVSQGRDQDALYVLSRTLRDHPDCLPAYNEIAGIYVRSDRLDDAIAVILAGLHKLPRDGVLLNNLGLCHLFKGEPAEALKHFTAATESMPTNPLYRSNRAAALALLGRHEQAEADYRTVLDRSQTRHNLAILARAREQQTITFFRADADAEAAASSIAPPAADPPDGPEKSSPPATQPSKGAREGRDLLKHVTG